jgi:hypothetical protein
VLRQRGKVASYLAKYVFNSNFREGEEKACDKWAYLHRWDSPFLTVARVANRETTPETEV